MRIGVIQASSQKSKNILLYDTVCKTAKQHEVINFGCYENENKEYSYIDVAFEIGLLISSGAVDFVISGCSSGQGMMLACNAFADVMCGYCENPQDAFLFGRINDGNAISIPLGLNFGWCGEKNLEYTLAALFDGPFGSGYPVEDALRKQKDTEQLKRLYHISKRNIIEVLEEYEDEVIKKVLSRTCVTDYIIKNGTDSEMIKWVKSKRNQDAKVLEGR